MPARTPSRFTARLLVSLALAAIVVTAVASASSASHSSPVTCKGSLIAKLTQGPDSGLTLKGSYILRLTSSGTFTGTLSDAKGPVSMLGQANGLSVNWIFMLSGARKVYVTGTALRPLTTCASMPAVFWGVATGPRFGDLGV